MLEPAPYTLLREAGETAFAEEIGARNRDFIETVRAGGLNDAAMEDYLDYFNDRTGILAEPGRGDADPDAGLGEAPGRRARRGAAAENAPRRPRRDLGPGRRDPGRRDGSAAREAVRTGRRGDPGRRAHRPAGRRPHDDPDPRPGDRRPPQETRHSDCS